MATLHFNSGQTLDDRSRHRRKVVRRTSLVTCPLTFPLGFSWPSPKALVLLKNVTANGLHEVRVQHHVITQFQAKTFSVLNSLDLFQEVFPAATSKVRSTTVRPARRHGGPHVARSLQCPQLTTRSDRRLHTAHTHARLVNNHGATPTLVR